MEVIYYVIDEKTRYSSIISIISLPQQQGGFSTLRFTSPLQQTSNSSRLLRPHTLHWNIGKAKTMNRTTINDIKSYYNSLDYSHCFEFCDAEVAVVTAILNSQFSSCLSGVWRVLPHLGLTGFAWNWQNTKLFWHSGTTSKKPKLSS